MSRLNGERLLCKFRKDDYKASQEKAKGNLAWSYYKLGDFDRALQLFSEAEQEVRTLGAGYEQIRWRNNLGLIHEQTGQLNQAARTTARRLPSRSNREIKIRQPLP